MSGVTSKLWYPTPDNEPADTLCRLFVIPNDPRMRAALDDMIARLTNPKAWEEIGVSPDIAASMAAEAFHSMVECPEVSGGDVANLPITLWADEFDYSNTLGREISVSSSQIHNLSVRLYPGALGDEFEIEFACGAGTYTIYILGIKTTGSGIHTVFIDSGSVGTFDFYGATTYNTVLTIPDVIISEGVHRFRVQTTGTSGSVYRTSLTKFWLVPND